MEQARFVEAERTSSTYPQQLLHPVLNLRLQCLIHRLLLSHFLGGGSDDSGGSWRNFHGGRVVSVGHDNDKFKCNARRRKEEKRYKSPNKSRWDSTAASGMLSLSARVGNSSYN